MTTLAARPGLNGRARPSLGDQLDRLDAILNGLADALNESVTDAVRAAAGRTVREAVEAAARDWAARSAQVCARRMPHHEDRVGVAAVLLGMIVNPAKRLGNVAGHLCHGDVGDEAI